jgi:hypothetical protein
MDSIASVPLNLFGIDLSGTPLSFQQLADLLPIPDLRSIQAQQFLQCRVVGPPPSILYVAERRF